MLLYFRMEINDILALSYQPFVRHFMNQATGKEDFSNIKNNLVVVRTQRAPSSKKNEASIELVSPVSQNIEQAKEAVKKSPKKNSIIPLEITNTEVTESLSHKRKRKQPNKKNPPKKKKKHTDIFASRK